MKSQQQYLKSKILLVAFFAMQLCLHAQVSNPMPAVTTPKPIERVPMGDWESFPEMKLDIPVRPGPFEPGWESIEKN